MSIRPSVTRLCYVKTAKRLTATSLSFRRTKPRSKNSDMVTLTSPGR